MSAEPIADTATQAGLSWRIPTTGDPRQLRQALAQVGLATIVAALVLLVAAPGPWLVPALAGLIPLAVFVAFRRWRRFQQAMMGPANVWIERDGLAWLDAAGGRQSFGRSDVRAFRVGLEPDTLRAVPALTLHLAGGFESQPLELYPPATPAAVRQALVEAWGIPERAADDADRGYDHAVDVYSECHDESREWHWEGAPAALAEFFEHVRAAAGELAAPPVGAKPASRVILCRRRAAARLRVAHSLAVHWEPDLIASPAAVLTEFADQGLRQARAAAVPGDAHYELRLPQGDIWTIHLHARDP